MKSRSRRPLKIIFISLGLIAVIATAATGIFIYTELSKINTPDKMTEVAPENEIFDTKDNSDFGAQAPKVEPEDIVWPAEIKPADDKKIINILLIGQDKRPGEKRARSDAMIIASYNKKEGTLKFISLMRDMYVPIPGYSDNRINAAYTFGGMKLLDKTIEKDFGVSIDGNIEVNFEGFAQLVDMLGGVDLVLNKAEAAHLNKKFGWKLTEGTNHLDGQQTLEYARIRYVGNGDYERTDRQRTVLTHIFTGIMQLSMAKKYKMLDQILPYLTTDMSKQDILGYAYTVLANGVAHTASYRIPEEGTYKSAKIREMAVLVPNLTKNRTLMKTYIDT